MASTGLYIKNLSDMMNKSFAENLKYHLHEAETFRELFNTRDAINQQYLQMDKSLVAKKDKLFKLRDATKWGGFKDQSEMLRLSGELLKDRDSAFEYMLPDDSKLLELKRQEVCFYSNQCWDEIRRVSKDNASLLYEHFKDMALLQCTHLSSVRYFISKSYRMHPHGRSLLHSLLTHARKKNSQNKS